MSPARLWGVGSSYFGVCAYVSLGLKVCGYVGLGLWVSGSHPPIGVVTLALLRFAPFLARRGEVPSELKNPMGLWVSAGRILFYLFGVVYSNPYMV